MLKTQFTPPIEKRETIELIGMAHCTTDFWQEEAKEQAREELLKRKVPMEEQLSHITAWNKEIAEYEKEREKELQANAVKIYSFFQCIIIVFLAPLILLGKVSYDMSITELRNENFTQKVEQRQWSLVLGALLYATTFYLLSATPIR